jgi:WD40 repeat protein
MKPTSLLPAALGLLFCDAIAAQTPATTTAPKPASGSAKTATKPALATATKPAAVAAPQSHPTLEVTKQALRVLRDECLACHKPGKAKGGLLMHQREKLLEGGENGAVVELGQAQKSLLWQVLKDQGDAHMPPKKQLSAAQIQSIADWINLKAPWDASVFDEAPKPRVVALKELPKTLQPVLALALSPDQKQLAVARANRVQLVALDQPNRPLLASLGDQTEAVSAVAFSRDGKWLLVGGFQKASLWELASRQKKLELRAELLGPINALCFSADGTAAYLADGEPNSAGFIRQFNLQNASLQATWKAHDDSILSLRLNTKGDLLLSAGADRMARLWQCSTRTLKGTYEGHTNHVAGACFNADATQIATAGADRELKVWDVASREQDASLGDKRVSFSALDWSPDGKTLAAATDKGGLYLHSDIKKHDGAQRSETSKERKLPPCGQPITTVVISADSQWVYAGSFTGTVQVYNAAKGLLEGELKL